MPRDFVVGGHNYRAGKMTAMSQFHVVRRLAPVLTGIGKAVAEAPSPAELVGQLANGQLENLLPMVGPIAEALRSMSDQDTEYVINRCLQVVARQQEGGSWAAVWNQAAARPMFDDIDLPQLLQITWEVLNENFEGFFPGRAPA